MTQGPVSDLLWLVSRAAGVVALVLISVTVLFGLAMAAKVLRNPNRRRLAVSLHEDLALIALVSLAIHGITLLGDTWLRPGLVGITVPFALSYRPVFTGLGIIGGYLAMLLGLSFYIRRRIGAKRWRNLHRLTVVIWPLAAVHALGSGSDAAHLWLRLVVLAPFPVIAYLVVVRVLSGRASSATKRPRPPSSPEPSSPETPSTETRSPTSTPRRSAPRALPGLPGSLEAEGTVRV